MENNINYKLISEEINHILSGVYSLFVADGRPTKKGGLRFLDVKSNKTFGFEKTRETDKGNLLVLSAPYYFPLENTAIKEKLESEIRKSRNSGRVHEIWIRGSYDKGKENKNFVEIKYIVPTSELLDMENIKKYSEQLKTSDTRKIVRNILRDNIETFAKEEMENLINIIRDLDANAEKK